MAALPFISCCVRAWIPELHPWIPTDSEAGKEKQEVVGGGKVREGSKGCYSLAFSSLVNLCEA